MRMKAYKDLSKDELLTVKAALEEEYETLESKGLNLNMARGKPGYSQLALSMPMLDVINSSSDMRTLLGNDTRNYGDLDGIVTKLVTKLYEELDEVANGVYA